MNRTENVELTALCLIHRDNQYILQDRVKSDWRGFTLPGGHIEKDESIVDAYKKSITWFVYSFSLSFTTLAALRLRLSSIAA